MFNLSFGSECKQSTWDCSSVVIKYLLISTVLKSCIMFYFSGTGCNIEGHMVELVYNN